MRVKSTFRQRPVQLKSTNDDVITLDEWQASGSTRKPDPAIYSYDARNRCWVLKEDVR
jgi:hypothetical protein